MYPDSPLLLCLASAFLFLQLKSGLNLGVNAFSVDGIVSLGQVGAAVAVVVEGDDIIRQEVLVHASVPQVTGIGEIIQDPAAIPVWGRICRA